MHFNRSSSRMLIVTRVSCRIDSLHARRLEAVRHNPQPLRRTFLSSQKRTFVLSRHILSSHNVYYDKYDKRRSIRCRDVASHPTWHPAMNSDAENSCLFNDLYRSAIPPLNVMPN